jgi:hypothetical protein
MSGKRVYGNMNRNLIRIENQLKLEKVWRLRKSEA